MSQFRSAVSVVFACGALAAAPSVTAEQYQYRDSLGQIVASKQVPPAGTSYAVLDDNGVYQYLVHASAQLVPKIEWQVSTISEDVDTEGYLRILQAPLASLNLDGAGGE